MTLNAYLAYAQTPPPVQLGQVPITPPTLSFSGGGAEISLTYNPQGTDPTGAAVHWLNIVQSNMIGASWAAIQVSQAPAPDAYIYIDDGRNPNVLTQGPFYDTVTGAANATAFVDAPGRQWDSSNWWLGMTFIATWDPDAKTIGVSTQAVVWGFRDPAEAAIVPEPSTLMLFCPGILAVIGMLRRRGGGKTCQPGAESARPFRLPWVGRMRG
jgi:hypothetical protein